MTQPFEIEHRHLSGGVLDPQVEALLAEMEKENAPPMESISPEENRRAIVQVLEEIGGELMPVAKVEDRLLAGPDRDIPVRIYTPNGIGPIPNDPFPVLVHFHGGGWVVCSTATHDAPCQKLCHYAGCIVVSVDYRLSPEHRFPSANDDAFHTVQWIAANGSTIGADPKRIAVGGDSAGGNMAAVTALRCRDENGPELALQLLVYPVTDLSRMDTETYNTYGENYFLTKSTMAWFKQHYLNSPEEAESPYASPLLAPSLKHLPPALVITAEFDPLREEGENYARRLAEEGTPVQCSRYNGMIHPFWSMGGAIDRADHAHREAAEALRQAFASV